MLIFEVKYLIGILIAIDIVFFIFLIMLFRRFNHIRKNTLLDNEIKTFESLIRDSDETAGQFNEQLKDKKQLIEKLNKKLDKRISSLKVLLSRSDILLSESSTQNGSDDAIDKKQVSRRHDILNLAKDGKQIGEIAQKLSIPHGEVLLTLNMSRKISEQSKNTITNQMGNEAGAK